jgi:hypothetical protein
MSPTLALMPAFRKLFVKHNITAPRPHQSSVRVEAGVGVSCEPMVFDIIVISHILTICLNDVVSVPARRRASLKSRMSSLLTLRTAGRG